MLAAEDAADDEVFVLAPFAAVAAEDAFLLHPQLGNHAAGGRIAGEVVGEHSFQLQGLDPKAYGWYLDLRKYGTFMHSGFGLGVERTVAWICGIPHIRETIAFPRQIHRLYP